MNDHFLQSRPRLLTSIALAFVVTFILGFFYIPLNFSFLEKFLIAYNFFQWSYFFSLLQLILTTGHHKIREKALSQDENANFVLAFSIVASILTLVTIAFELSSAKQSFGISKSIHLILPAITLLGVWSLLPTMFAIHYAHLFYLQEDNNKKPLHFPDHPTNPDYFDFLYFAANIAVASQTADVEVMSSRMRRIVTLQCILSFLFNTSVLALGINVAASLLQ